MQFRKVTAWVLGIACIASIPAAGDTITISYSFAGATTGAPVITGTTLAVDGLATGSVTQWNPSVNAFWNPATFHTHNVVELTNGLDNGSFSIVFANGDMLSGNLFENDSAVNVATGAGPFTQTLTFTAGTGEFLGATGSVSGGGLITSTGFTTSGSGTLTAAGVAAPEPASIALLFGGLLVIAARRKLRTLIRNCSDVPENRLLARAAQYRATTARECSVSKA
jgi:hypothetical protein